VDRGSLVPRVDHPKTFVEAGIVDRQDLVTREGEDDLDASRLEGLDEDVSAGQQGGQPHPFAS
jgi:hypothetical protein